MTENKGGKIGGLLLAAGGSSRLGHPKQLIQFQGKTLIRRATETLVDSGCHPIVVVLGAEIDGSTSEIAELPVHICINRGWQIGMSSSIRIGLEELFSIEPNLAAVVITLCDQPHVSSADIDRLIIEFQSSSSPMVAATYGGIVGVPALFSKDVFNELSQLEGDKGARQLIKDHSVWVKAIEIDNAAVDIDVSDDLDRLFVD